MEPQRNAGLPAEAHAKAGERGWRGFKLRVPGLWFPRPPSGFRLPASAPRRAGFTLVELLVVIAIITILASLVMTASVRALDAARAGQCKSNLSQFGKAMLMYVHRNDGWMPAIGSPAGGYQGWYDSLAEHMSTDAQTRKIYHCPAKPQTTVGYGVNVRFADPDYSGDTHAWNQTLPITIVNNPSQTIAICDAGQVVNYTENPQKWRETDASPPDGKVRFPFADPDPYWGLATTFRPVPRHRGLCNCLMFDASVSAHRPADLVACQYGDSGCLWDNQ